MSFPTGMIGFTSASAKKMVLRSGAAFRNLNLSKLRTNGWAAAINPSNVWTCALGIERTPGPLGATRNGAKANPNKVQSQVKVDGTYMPLVEFDKVQSYAPMVTLTLLECADKDTAVMQLGVADITPWDAANYDEVTPSLEIAPENYMGNIALAARVSDKRVNQPYLIILEYCIVEKTTEISLVDDPGEAAVECEFQGRATILDPHAVPIHYFIPRRTGSGS